MIDEALAGAEGGLAADRFNDRFLSDLQKDRDTLATMAAKLEGLKDSPDPKLESLRRVMAETPSQKVAVFTAFQDTAAYLKALYRDATGTAGRTLVDDGHGFGDTRGRPNSGA